MAKSDKLPAHKDPKLSNTTVWLTKENKQYLYKRKVEGKGTLSEQVNKLLEAARAVWGGSEATVDTLDDMGQNP